MLLSKTKWAEVAEEVVREVDQRILALAIEAATTKMTTWFLMVVIRSLRVGAADIKVTGLASIEDAEVVLAVAPTTADVADPAATGTGTLSPRTPVLLAWAPGQATRHREEIIATINVSPQPKSALTITTTELIDHPSQAMVTRTTTTPTTTITINSPTPTTTNKTPTVPIVPAATSHPNPKQTTTPSPSIQAVLTSLPRQQATMPTATTITIRLIRSPTSIMSSNIPLTTLQTMLRVAARRIRTRMRIRDRGKGTALLAIFPRQIEDSVMSRTRVRLRVGATSTLRKLMVGLGTHRLMRGGVGARGRRKTIIM